MGRPQLGMLAICVLVLGLAGWWSSGPIDRSLLVIPAAAAGWFLLRAPPRWAWWSVVISGLALQGVLSTAHQADHFQSVEALAKNAVRVALAEGPLNGGRYWCSGWQSVEDLAMPRWVHSVVIAVYPAPDRGQWMVVGTVRSSHGDFEFWAPNGGPYVDVASRGSWRDGVDMHAWLAFEQRDCPADADEGGT